MRPSATVQLAAVPTFGPGNEITVPSGAECRLVYGTVSVTALSNLDAFVTAEVENAVGSAVYDEVLEIRASAGLLQNVRSPFAFAVEGGRRYRFLRSGGAGTTETLLKYSYSDL